MVTVVVRTTEGDVETITMLESGPNTGRFFGIIPTVPSPPPGVAGDCRLSVAPGSTVTMRVSDAAHADRMKAYWRERLDALKAQME